MWDPLPQCERKYGRPVYTWVKLKEWTSETRQSWMKLPASSINTAVARCRVQLPPLAGTTYESSSMNVYYPGDTLRVTCGENYWISSPQDTFADTTCNDEGQWTIRPVCEGTESQHPQAFVSLVTSVPNSNLSCSRGGMHQSSTLQRQMVGCLVERGTQAGKEGTIWVCQGLQKGLLLGSMHQKWLGTQTPMSRYCECPVFFHFS